MVDKDFLKIHAEHRSELEDELRRYEMMNGNTFYRSPSDIDGMPHALGGSSDKMADAVIRKTDSSTFIGALKEQIKKEEAEIEAVLALLPKAKQKTVIRVKYYNLYDWDDVAMFMFGDKSDYSRNTEKYKEKAQRIHGTALANMKKVQEEKKNE